MPAAAQLTALPPTQMMRWSLPTSASSVLRGVLQHPSVRAAGGFATLTLVVKAVSFLKEAVVAAAFGVGSSMDSYLMALAVIGFPSGVLLNAAQTVLVRDYVRAAELNSAAAAESYLRRALAMVLAVVTVVLMVWLALLPAILAVVGHGLSGAQRALVTHNMYLLIPYYYLNSVNVLGYGALQARRAFRPAALIPIATPLAMLGVMAAAGASLAALIGLMTLGTAAESVLILTALPRAARRGPASAHEVRRWSRGFVRATLTLVPGTLVAGLTPLIEQTIASGLGRGAISALGYGAKLPQTLNSLLVTSIGVTVFPYFAQRLSCGYDAACRRFFIRYALFVLCTGLAISIVAMLTSETFVRIAFQHGMFSPQSTVTVTALQRAYLWQLPGALVAITAVRFAAAQGRYRALTLGNLLMVPITGVLQWRLASSWGPRGLALGASLGQVAAAVLFVWLVLRAPLDPHPRTPVTNA